MKILIVDDQQLFRSAFIRLLKTIYPASTCEEAANGTEALEKLKSLKFHLVFLDVSMPIMDGYETFKCIRQDYPALPIIMLTQYDEPHLIYHFYKMGVQSFLTKGASMADVTAGVDRVLAGEKYFPEKVKSIVDKALGKENEHRVELAPQEKKLIQLLQLGLTSKEIAQKMGLTEKTARTYRERLMKKTNTKNVAQLISFGFMTGILPC